jgi:hypothetical protein
MRWGLLAGLALGLLTGSCAGGPGAFCSRDSDCRSGLRCVLGGAGGRGLCTYPPSTDAAPLDSRPVDQRGLEGKRDARPAEASPADAPGPDSLPVDSSAEGISTDFAPGD